MSIERLIGEAQGQNIELFLDNGKLGYRAYQQQPDKRLLQRLSENKEAILAYLQRQQLSSIDVTQPHPVSTSQQRIWTIAQLEEDSTEFHIPVALLIAEPIDLKELTQRLDSILQHHTTLRCRFFEKNGQLWQQATEATSFTPEIEDFSHLSHDEAVAQAQQVITTDNQRPFNLTNDLPLRATFFKLAQQQAIVYLNIHHIAVDESSVTLLLNALFDVGPTVVSNEATQYFDYVYWQQTYLQSSSFRQKLEAYANHLEDAPALHSLILDKPYSINTGSNAGTVKVKLADDLVGAAYQLCQQHQLTPFMLFQGAFSAFLSVWTNTSDIVLGTPSILRPQEKFNHVIGCFLNLSVLRSSFSPDMTCLDVVRQARQLSINLLDWQTVPFEALMEELRPERSPLYSPLFQILFSMHMLTDMPQKETQQISSLGISNHKTKYDLTLHSNVSKKHISFSWEYKTDLFNADTIEQLARAFCQFLQQFIAKPSLPLRHINVVDDLALGAIKTFNDTACPFPLTSKLDQLISLQAQKHPHKTAIECSTYLSYQQLEDKSTHIAKALILAGVTAGDHVGVMLDRSATMVCCMLALMKIEAAYIPLDPSYPAARLQYIFQQADCKFLIADTENDAQLVRTRNWLSPTVLLSSTASTELPATRLGPDAIAYLIFTSGSTGEPKGIQITHGNVVNFLFSMQNKPGLGPTDKLLAVTPTSFDISVLELFLPLLSGAALVIAQQDQRDGYSLAQRMALGDITIMQATPAGWQSIIDAGWTGQSNLKALCGGEALPSALAKQLLAKTGSLWNMYGPTETTVWSSTKQITQQNADAISLGKPINNTGIYVVNTAQKLCAPGQVGEIAITGAGLSKGYYQKDDLTSERFINLDTPDGVQRAYLTGDLGRLTTDTDLQYLGRNDDQIKLRGFRIELAEIDAHLMAFPHIKQVATVLHISATGSVQLISYFCSSQHDLSTSTQQFLLQLRGQLPAHMVPDRIIQLPVMPLTPSGKIDKKSLAAKPTEMVEEQYASPKTELERDLAEFWQKLTGKQQVGINDNFFAIGGDSVSSVKVVRFLRDKGFDMNNKLLFSHQTIKDLTAHLSAIVKTSNSKINELEFDGVEMLLPEGTEGSDFADILNEFSQLTKP